MEKAARVISNIIYVLGLCLLFLLLFTIGVYRVNINFGQELVNINHNHLSFYILLIAGICIMVFVGISKRFSIERIPEHKLFPVLSIAFLIAGFFLIFNTDMTLRNDPNYCFSAAKDFNRGDYRSLLYFNYLGYDPHQLGLVTFERILCLFSEKIIFFQIVNLLLSILNNLIIFKVTDMLFAGNALINRYAIMLSFMFLPQLFFIMYIYGNIPGFTFLLGAYYFAVRLMTDRGKAWVNVCLCAFLGICSSLIRSNYLIGVLALALTCALEFLNRHKFKRVIALLILTALVCLLPVKALHLYYRMESGIEVSRGTPMILYVAMGLQEGPMGNGWYNAYNNNTYEDNGYDYEVAAAIGRAEIGNRLKTFAADPAYAYDFFSKKYISTWADPTFQSVNSAPAITLENWDDRVRGEFLNNLYSGGKVYSIVSTLCNVVNFIIVAATLIFFLVSFRNKEAKPLRYICLLFLLYTMGGTLFHLVWETKARYMQSYIYILIPAAAAGLSHAVQSVRGRYAGKDQCGRDIQASCSGNKSEGHLRRDALWLKNCCR